MGREGEWELWFGLVGRMLYVHSLSTEIQGRGVEEVL